MEFDFFQEMTSGESCDDDAWKVIQGQYIGFQHPCSIETVSLVCGIGPARLTCKGAKIDSLITRPSRLHAKYMHVNICVKAGRSG